MFVWVPSIDPRQYNDIYVYHCIHAYVLCDIQHVIFIFTVDIVTLYIPDDSEFDNLYIYCVYADFCLISYISTDVQDTRKHQCIYI